ncbi:MAG TPA: hypothetical protein VF695_13220 [Sphingomonas sp.]|jgi:hypothetical protein
MADILLALTIPSAAGSLGWWIATLSRPRLARLAANDNTPLPVRLPHPLLSYSRDFD